MTDPFLDLAEQNVERLKHLPRVNHPALENARLAVDPMRDELGTPEYEASQRLWRAIMVSPTPEVCRALLQGERVPRNRLDALWLRRLGLRRKEAA